MLHIFISPSCSFLCTEMPSIPHSAERSSWTTFILQTCVNYLTGWSWDNIRALKWASNEGCVDWQVSLSLCMYAFENFQYEHAVAAICAMGNLHPGVVHTKDRTRCRMLCPCMLYFASLCPEKSALWIKWIFPWADTSSQEWVKEKAPSDLLLEQFYIR